MPSVHGFESGYLVAVALWSNLNPKLVVVILCFCGIKVGKLESLIGC